MPNLVIAKAALVYPNAGGQQAVAEAGGTTAKNRYMVESLLLAFYSLIWHINFPAFLTRELRCKCQSL